MKKQIIIIHGGNCFKNYRDYVFSLKKLRIDFKRYLSQKHDWKSSLPKKLGNKFEVIVPTMPNKANAKYLEWKIWFEKFIPFIKSRVILIGHSLGGIFLAKYLSENKFSKKIRATFLVAAPYGEGDFVVPKILKKLEIQGGKVFLYHSKDDPIVSFINFEKYQKALKTATNRIFIDKGHFNQEQFPELIKDIKNL